MELKKAMNETVKVLCQLWEGDLSCDSAKQAMLTFGGFTVHTYPHTYSD